MASKQIAGLTAGTIGLTDVLPFQDAAATSEAKKTTVTELQTAMTGKQNTLVSATNIKTINGSSVLGSGDLTVSASLGYNIYKALVSLDVGSGLFTVVQLQNTIGDGSGDGVNDIAWTNPSNGVIRATMTNGTPFPSNKVFIPQSTYNNAGSPYFVNGTRAANTICTFNLILHDGTQTGTPSLTRLPIEIQVYP